MYLLLDLLHTCSNYSANFLPNTTFVVVLEKNPIFCGWRSSAPLIHGSLVHLDLIISIVNIICALAGRVCIQLQTLCKRQIPAQVVYQHIPPLKILAHRRQLWKDCTHKCFQQFCSAEYWTHTRRRHLPARTDAHGILASTSNSTDPASSAEHRSVALGKDPPPTLQLLIKSWSLFLMLFVPQAEDQRKIKTNKNKANIKSTFKCILDKDFNI